MVVQKKKKGRGSAPGAKPKDKKQSASGGDKSKRGTKLKKEIDNLLAQIPSSRKWELVGLLHFSRTLSEMSVERRRDVLGVLQELLGKKEASVAQLTGFFIGILIAVSDKDSV